MEEKTLIEVRIHLVNEFFIIWGEIKIDISFVHLFQDNQIEVNFYCIIYQHNEELKQQIKGVKFNICKFKAQGNTLN